ncbi:hypothetical protein D9619_011171 [Psilocybe cf. subviscida]|uniref:cystathionine gamma-lyase n=1 Tax=Psilocybe cf. subviscida TaxID=2480587 RepID=A0A8H5BJU9_9AGAR|nr:hypothetical protein D9619_011171 [Psilocybe cf. subviscida]
MVALAPGGFADEIIQKDVAFLRHNGLDELFTSCGPFPVVSHSRSSDGGDARCSSLGALCAGRFAAGYKYSCSGNPNRHLLERTFASLESSPAQSNVALAFSSGSSTTSAVLSALGPNAHIPPVSPEHLFYLENASDAEILGALRENMKLVWIESPTSPTLRVVDVSHLVRYRARFEGGTADRVGGQYLPASVLRQPAGAGNVVMGAFILPEPASSNQPKLADKLRFCALCRR